MLQMLTWKQVSPVNSFLQNGVARKSVACLQGPLGLVIMCMWCGAVVLLAADHCMLPPHMAAVVCSRLVETCPARSA